MRLGWQVLLPLSVLNLLLTATVIAFGWPWWISGAAGVVILASAAVVLFLRLRRALPAATPRDEQLGLALPSSVRLVRLDAHGTSETGEGTGRGNGAASLAVNAGETSS
jgi:hypothetical protein